MIDVNKIKVGDKLKILSASLRRGQPSDIVEVVDYELPGEFWLDSGFAELSWIKQFAKDFDLVEEFDEETNPQKIKVLTSDYEYQGLYKGSIHIVESRFDDGVQFWQNNRLWTLSDNDYEDYEEPLISDAKPDSALDKQEGGGHYKGLKIQPIEYIHANGLSYFQGNVVKYVSRYKDKNGAEDIKKAIHYLELILELEYGSK